MAIADEAYVPLSMAQQMCREAAAAEREACAKVVDGLRLFPDEELVALDPNPSHQRAGAIARRNACDAIAATIRARGLKP